MTQCMSNQECYAERHDHGITPRFTLGCMDNQRCSDHQDFTIVGRAADNPCFDRCSLSGCNRERCGQDSLQVKRRNDNHSPGPVIRELDPSSHQR